MGRSPCCDGVGLKRGPWTPEEDRKLFDYIQENGHGSWRSLPQKAGLQRCGKSCRLRWINYLRPDIKRGKFTIYEEQTIIQLHALLGNRWSTIAAHLQNRTDNEIKNYWNTRLKKRLTKMGIDPETHKKKNTLCSNNKTSMNMSVIDHIAQWESTRLEAEARLTKESKLRLQKLNALQSPYQNEPPTTTAAFGFRPSFDILKAWQSGYGNTKAPPYTLSFLETAVAMLESPTTTAKVDVDKNSDEVSNVVGEHVVVSDDHVGNGDEWKLDQENYWDDFFSNSETLYSVVF